MLNIDVLLFPPALLFDSLPLEVRLYPMSSLIKQGFRQFILPKINTWEFFYNAFKNQKLVKIMLLEVPFDSNSGDILRQIKMRNLTESQILIVPLNTYIDINLLSLVEEHITRYKQDSDIVMTQVFSQNLNFMRNPTLLLSKDSKMMQIQRVKNGKQIEISFLRFNKKDLQGCKLRTDLFDTQISVLSHQVLKSFKQNFYFTCLQDFTHNILTTQVNAQKVHVEIAPYAFSVQKSQDQLTLMIDLLLNKLSSFTLNGHKSGLLICKNSSWFDKRQGQVVYVGHNSKVSQSSFLRWTIVLDQAIIQQNCELNNCLVKKGSIVPKGTKAQNIIFQKDGSFIEIIPQRQEEIIFPNLNQAESEQKSDENQLQDLLKDVVLTPVQQRQDKGQQLNAYLKSRAIPINPVIALSLNQIKGKTAGQYKAWAQNWAVFLKQFINDQVSFIEKLFTEALTNQNALEGFHVILQLLYKEQVLQGASILSWQCPSQAVHSRMAKFIEFLKQEDEDQEDDS